MSDLIEYKGTPEEWRKLHAGVLPKPKPVKSDKKTAKPVKLYNLLYNGNVVARSAPFAVCRAKQADCQRSNNYRQGKFEIKPII